MRRPCAACRRNSRLKTALLKQRKPKRSAAAACRPPSARVCAARRMRSCRSADGWNRTPDAGLRTDCSETAGSDNRPAPVFSSARMRKTKDGASADIPGHTRPAGSDSRARDSFRMLRSEPVFSAAKRRSARRAAAAGRFQGTDGSARTPAGPCSNRPWTRCRPNAAGYSNRHIFQALCILLRARKRPVMHQ